MKRLTVVLGTLVMSGCASTVSPSSPQPPSAASWSTVMGIEWRAELSVLFDCRGDAGDVHLPEGVTAAEDVCRVVGSFLQAGSRSILVRPAAPEARVVQIARRDVVRIFARQRGSQKTPALIGAAVGTALCALGGLYGEDDWLVSGKIFFTAVCAGGGAGIGYLTSRKPPALRLVYARSGQSGRRRSSGRQRPSDGRPPHHGPPHR